MASKKKTRGSKKATTAGVTRKAPASKKTAVFRDSKPRAAATAGAPTSERGRAMRGEGSRAGGLGTMHLVEHAVPVRASSAQPGRMMVEAALPVRETYQKPREQRVLAARKAAFSRQKAANAPEIEGFLPIRAGKGKAFGKDATILRATGILNVSLHDGMERVAYIRAGAPALSIVEMSGLMDMTRDRLYDTLNLPRSTLERKIKDKDVLSPEHTERLLGLQRLVKQVEQIAQESGDPQGFDAAAWVGGWLEDPQPALGGATPGSLLDTMQGQELISSLLARVQSGAYS